ncbi:hypothetical protein M407DRAFT_240898 [Tulasnella calospora MUT 4182]|uniref:Uncharacterized protein n=1 Tax=Tulasnella calospora MUT 4182 TaxID=1051891 RepID=A0A0C3QLP2_9AGAM|nr:hypothetical protein M407DRAFT_240898 [Tulasnella calospora MUT 4182]
MPRTRQMFEAAALLSSYLSAAGIPHAFYGGFTSVALGSSRDTEDMCCVVEGGFRPVRQALQDCDVLTASQSSWSGRLFVTYQEPIPAMEIEVLKAGETGPRKLNASNVMLINRVPFLSVSEFLRAKINNWLIHGSESDAHDIIFVLSTFSQNVDLNRIPEFDMDRFCKSYPGEASFAWNSIKNRYEQVL